jgi:heavy metal sensor kinase
MNTSSLRLRLLAWYAGLLLGSFAVLAGATYLALEGSLVSALRESLWRRGRQIAHLLSDEIQHHTEANVGEEIQVRYAPDLNDRFVRITQQDGVLRYLSRPPRDHDFDPAALPPPAWPDKDEAARKALLIGGRRMLLASHVLQMPGRAKYLIETGAPMDEMQADLRKWLVFLLVLLPIVAAIALGGGYVLVGRALSPVHRIAASAERISSHNLSERLPLANTGDELDRLSGALNRMIDRLDSAFQYSRRFVADASHELRTPLTILRGELEMLALEPGLSPEARDRLGSALEEVERLANIVEGLFAISRLDAGEAAAEWVKFDLAQLAAGTADQMSLMAEDRKIQVRCNAPRSVWVEGDRARIKQVVVNLLDNAIKYTPEGGEVDLKVGAQNSTAVLEVADNGPGIPPEALPRVFERFFRVDNVRSRLQGGAGLGLSIVKSICAAHRGRVEASSTFGQGSCFRVELPLTSAPANNR